MDLVLTNPSATLKQKNKALAQFSDVEGNFAKDNIFVRRIQTFGPWTLKQQITSQMMKNKKKMSKFVCHGVNMAQKLLSDLRSVSLKRRDVDDYASNRCEVSTIVWRWLHGAPVLYSFVVPFFIGSNTIDANQWIDIYDEVLKDHIKLIKTLKHEINALAIDRKSHKDKANVSLIDDLGHLYVFDGDGIG